MAEENKDLTPEEALKADLKRGGYIFMLLAVLTVGEFIVASIAAPWVFVLWTVAAWKAFLVVRDYMHLGKIFKSDEEAH